MEQDLLDLMFIQFLLKKTKYKIISLDNYSSGSKTNHINDKRVNYLKGDTLEISKILKKYKNKIKSFFSFWRICKNFSKF